MRNIPPALRISARAILESPALPELVKLTEEHIAQEWINEENAVAREALHAQIMALQKMIVVFRKLANGLANGHSERERED